MNFASLKPTIDRALGGACGRFHVRSMWKAGVGQITRTVSQASPLRPPDPIPSLHAFRFDVAQAEGWDVFDCGLREDGTPRIEIQRLDSTAPGQPRFRTDGAAWEHVVARALEGAAKLAEMPKVPRPSGRGMASEVKVPAVLAAGMPAETYKGLHLAALAMLDPTERKLIRLWCPAAARLP